MGNTLRSVRFTSASHLFYSKKGILFSFFHGHPTDLHLIDYEIWVNTCCPFLNLPYKIRILGFNFVMNYYWNEPKTVTRNHCFQNCWWPPSVSWPISIHINDLVFYRILNSQFYFENTFSPNYFLPTLSLEVITLKVSWVILYVRFVSFRDISFLLLSLDSFEILGVNSF